MRKIVHFCKRLPLWANLNEDIQIRLIKGGLTEAMILFNTRDYDSKRDEVKFMDGKSRSKEAFYASGFNSEMIDGKYSLYYIGFELKLNLVIFFFQKCLIFGNIVTNIVWLIKSQLH